MDLLRSCYATKVRVCPTSLHEWDQEWFWCKDTAAIFPTWHSFGSLNYVADPPEDGIGEVAYAERPYRKGSGAPSGPGIFSGDPTPFQRGFCTVADTPAFRVPCWPFPVSSKAYMQFFPDGRKSMPLDEFPLTYDGARWVSGVLTDDEFVAGLTVGCQCASGTMLFLEVAPSPAILSTFAPGRYSKWTGEATAELGGTLRIRFG